MLKACSKGVLTLNKHDRYVQRLYDRIKPDFDVMQKHVVLSSRKSRKAEIDLIGYREGKAHVFEVKCSYRVVKARKQLRRLLRLLKQPVAAAYFYCGSADKLEKFSAKEIIQT